MLPCAGYRLYNVAVCSMMCVLVAEGHLLIMRGGVRASITANSSITTVQPCVYAVTKNQLLLQFLGYSYGQYLGLYRVTMGVACTVRRNASKGQGMLPVEERSVPELKQLGKLAWMLAETKMCHVSEFGTQNSDQSRGLLLDGEVSQPRRPTWPYPSKPPKSA